MAANHIAVIVTDIDSLLLPRHIGSQQLVYFVCDSSPILPWIQEYMPKLNTIPYSLYNRVSITDCYIHEILASSNIVELMRREHIRHLLPTQKVTHELFEAAKQDNIELIGPLFAQMQEFEDKIWFDRFMKKNHIPSPRSEISSISSISLKFPVVVQESTSWGSEGTYIINKPHELKDLDATQTYLIREFVQGKTYGITVCITNTGIHLSALRIQCSTKYAQFSGIQWVPTNFFSRSLQNNMRSIFGRLGNSMRVEGYAGWASFDFIIDDAENIFVIECNPRFTAASAHIVADSSLCGLASLHDVLIPRPIIAIGPVDVSAIPTSHFQGATQEINIDANMPITLPQPGFYEKKKSGMVYKHFGFESYQKDLGNLFFYTDARNGEVHPESTVAGVVVSQVSLYDENGQENSTTQDVMNFFTGGAILL